MFRTLLLGVQPARYGIVATLCAASTLHAADWISLRGAGVELVSDAGEKTARQALDRLAQIQRILPPASDSAALPLRIFLFAKQSEYRDYAPDAGVAGFYQTGIERDYIAMAAGGSLPRVVSHEYVHFVLHRQNTTRAMWLEEGLAELYSNFDGRVLGAPIAEHLRELEKPWLSAEQLNTPVDPDQRFYALSWALVHMLQREAEYPERVTSQMLADLRPYLKKMKAMPVDLRAAPTLEVYVDTVSPLNAILLRADLALHSRRPDVARKLYTQAAREFPNSSAVETGLGALAFGAGDRVGALAHLKRALELNDRDAMAWFELAQLEGDPAALERVVQLNPDFAEAHVLLGVRATDAGDLDAALWHLEQAAALLPRKSYAWYSLGFAQQKRGDVGGARRSLERALQVAATSEQRKMAATLLDSLER